MSAAEGLAPSPPSTTASETPAGVDLAVLERVHGAVSEVVRGNPACVRLLLATLLARGHALLEDVPGVGKTTLARALARVLGCAFQRVQFTADMLPSDVLGVQLLDPKAGTLIFRKGPIFAHLILADEINRASPKTQSALLEAMADRQVTIDDETHPLEEPFSVIATQNPVEHHGAYPLPESQLDRFMVSVSLGYPPAEDERRLIREHRGVEPALDVLTPLLDPARFRALQAQVQQVEISDPVAGYLLSLVESTRVRADVLLGCSPRGSIAWAALCRALALLDGRDFVRPDDVKATAGPVLGHRIVVRGSADGQLARTAALAVIDNLVAETPVPR